jgi:hypothetical protein
MNMIFISIMIVTNLLTLHNQLKIHHWQTKSYAEHQALGGAYDEFSGLIDEFIEVFMGKYGRIESRDGFKIELENYKDISPTDFADKYVDYLVNELPKSLEESDTDLFNIRDEMLAQLNKLKYLLTLS